MTSWNYRVIKKICKRTREATYQIHEIYYHEDGRIDCWSDTAVEPLGVSESSLRNDIRSFLGAFRLPILEEYVINGKSHLRCELFSKPGGDLQVDYANKATRAADYISQILGNHLLIKQDPTLREAYNKVDQALADLFDIVENQCGALEN